VTEIFNAATIGGARALGRDNIGRLAVGCKADIVIVDCAHPAMRPCHDPLRSLVYSASDRAVAHVFVDGEQVVRDQKVLTIDYEGRASRWRRLKRVACPGSANSTGRGEMRRRSRAPPSPGGSEAFSGAHKLTRVAFAAVSEPLAPWPGLSRPSTQPRVMDESDITNRGGKAAWMELSAHASLLAAISTPRHRDGRDKPGHDGRLPD
jgi:hypothetical protein